MLLEDYLMGGGDIDMNRLKSQSSVNPFKRITTIYILKEFMFYIRDAVDVNK